MERIGEPIGVALNNSINSNPSTKVSDRIQHTQTHGNQTHERLAPANSKSVSGTSKSASGNLDALPHLGMRRRSGLSKSTFQTKSLHSGQLLFSSVSNPASVLEQEVATESVLEKSGAIHSKTHLRKAHNGETEQIAPTTSEHSDRSGAILEQSIVDLEDLENTWLSVSGIISQNLDPQIYSAWIKPLAIEGISLTSIKEKHIGAPCSSGTGSSGIDALKVSLIAPNRFCRDHVSRNYTDLIEKHLSNQFNCPVVLDVTASPLVSSSVSSAGVISNPVGSRPEQQYVEQAPLLASASEFKHDAVSPLLSRAADYPERSNPLSPSSHQPSSDSNLNTIGYNLSDLGKRESDQGTVDLIVESKLSSRSTVPSSVSISSNRGPLPPNALKYSAPRNNDPRNSAPSKIEPIVPSARTVFSAKARSQVSKMNGHEAPSKEPVAPSSTFNLNPKYNFSNFIVGSCNQLAHAAGLRVAEHLGGSYNPLFLYGGVGLGKTHLANAIGNAAWRRNKKVLLVSSETFVSELVASLRTKRMDQFRAKFRSLDLLIVDDIQFIIGKECTQEEFFHTFNELYNNQKQIVITSDRLPQELNGLEERLKTRFASGLAVDMQAPDFETRVAILIRKAELAGAVLPDEAARILADAVDTNVRELEGALNRLFALSSLQKLPLTPELASRVLSSIPRTRSKEVTSDGIQQAVARLYNVSVGDITGKRRTQNIALARQVAMYLCRKMTGFSYPEIGAFFGGRDHSTVIHAFRSVSERLKVDSSFNQKLDELERQIRS